MRLLRDSWVSIFDRTRAVEGMSEELIDLSSCVAWPRPVARTQALGDGQGLLLGAVCLDAGGDGAIATGSIPDGGIPEDSLVR